MKTAGLIGGIGCASTMIYYQTIIDRISSRLGKEHTGNLVIYSIDEYEIIEPLKKREWNKIEHILKKITQELEKSGVDFILICSNTFHRFFDSVQGSTKLPVIHILLPICERITKEKYQKIGIIGTSITLKQHYYSDYLLKNSTAKKLLIPNEEQINTLDNIIFNELLNNEITDFSKKILMDIVQSLVDRGSECIILGCTEFSLILSQKDFPCPVLDSTHLHATYVADYMLAEN